MDRLIMTFRRWVCSAKGHQWLSYDDTTSKDCTRCGITT